MGTGIFQPPRKTIMSETNETQDDFNVEFFEAADTAILEVMNQKDEPLLYKGQPVTIEMYGPGTSQYARAQAKIDSASQTRAFAAIRGKQPKDAAEENRRLNAEKLAACTKSVNNFPIKGGALALFQNPKLGYITDQAVKFGNDWVNFPAASTTT